MAILRLLCLFLLWMRRINSQLIRAVEEGEDVEVGERGDGFLGDEAGGLMADEFRRFGKRLAGGGFKVEVDAAGRGGGEVDFELGAGENEGLRDHLASRVAGVQGGEAFDAEVIAAKVDGGLAVVLNDVEGHLVRPGGGGH